MKRAYGYTTLHDLNVQLSNIPDIASGLISVIFDADVACCLRGPKPVDEIRDVRLKSIATWSDEVSDWIEQDITALFGMQPALELTVLEACDRKAQAEVNARFADLTFTHTEYFD